MSVVLGWARLLTHGLIRLDAPATAGRQRQDSRLHRLQHRLHIQPSAIVLEWHNGRIWTGAKCLVCGQFSGWIIAAGDSSPCPVCGTGADGESYPCARSDCPGRRK
jgi:hypothetical protein